jgi:hypothetical protein
VQELQGGEQKTFECWVAFDEDPVSADPLEWCRAPSVMCVDPEWVIGTGAVPFLDRFETRHSALINAAVDGPDSFDRKREAIDEYGWRHFGDIYGDHEAVRTRPPDLLASHYNNQYDPIAGFALQFLRTGDPRWHRMMSELAAHVVDIDIYHTVRDKWAYNHGMFWHTYHYGDADTATHRTYPRSAQGTIHGGGPSADHNYTSGLLLHYLVTGSMASQQTVCESAEYVVDMDDGRKTLFRWLSRTDTGHAIRSAPGYYGPGRAPANSLNALVDGFCIAADVRFLQKAEHLIRRVIHPADDIDTLRLDDPERRWFYTMFLQSLGKYLQFKAERLERDAMYSYGRASLLHYARWMASKEHPYLEKPEKLEFPTETWAAQDIRKSDVFFYAALHATEDRQLFMERARFFYEYSLTTLQQTATRTLARPVVILLTSGFLHAWMIRYPLAAAERPAMSEQHGQPEKFVPQRELAIRRAALLAAGMLVALVVLAMMAL